MDSSLSLASDVLPFPSLPKTALHSLSNSSKLSLSIYYYIYIDRLEFGATKPILTETRVHKNQMQNNKVINHTIHTTLFEGLLKNDAIQDWYFHESLDVICN